jgi:hypothetical protein
MTRSVIHRLKRLNVSAVSDVLDALGINGPAGGFQS